MPEVQKFLVNESGIDKRGLVGFVSDDGHTSVMCLAFGKPGFCILSVFAETKLPFTRPLRCRPCWWQSCRW